MKTMKVWAADEVLTAPDLNQAFKDVRDALPWAMAAGRQVMPASVGPVSVQAITFPTGRFTAAPIVTVSSASATSGELFASVSDITATGCTLRLYRTTGAVFAAGPQVTWIAVQMTDTNGQG